MIIIIIVTIIIICFVLATMLTRKITGYMYKLIE